MNSSSLRIALLTVALMGSGSWLAWRRHWVEPLLAPLMGLRQARPTQPVLLLVVLDTVRADHLSVCGYARPTTPFLEELRQKGAQLSCGGVSAAAWTFPSHASLFTGVDVPTHRADFGYPQGTTWPDTIIARPLGPSLPTLAEEMVQQGYQSRAVSGNPLVSPSSGLTRGFESVRVGGRMEQRGALLAMLQDALWWDADERPLFLFLNIVDAHDPWEDIPKGVGWLSPRKGLEYGRGSHDPKDEFGRFMREEMGEEERTAFLERVTDLYDWGLRSADQTLRESMEILERQGWLSAGYRLVITSDHGEHLGEKGLLDHGRSLQEEAIRVPVMILESGGTQARLPPVMWSVHARDLLKEGKLPERLETPRATAVPDLAWQTWFGKGRSTSVAVWEGSQKNLWKDGQLSRFDLEKDPKELNPLPVEAEPPELVDLRRRVGLMMADSVEVDPQMMEALKAAGYMQ